MEGGEGMVAVVRGLRDSGLAVTLLDGSREYTLMPNAMLQTSPAPTRDVASFRASRQQSTQHDAASTDAVHGSNYSRNTGAQVTDGRYASIYKMAHCHVKPSSPPIELTEFPPQRAALHRGHGNFEVGGAGSGETYTPVKTNGKFRGGMSWPDRGSVCSPRPSHETDAFANSLRKYPCVSPDRSSEIVERLINYTQSRASKTYSIKNQTSPQRIPDSSSSHNLKCSRASTPKTPQRYDPGRDRPRGEESPTRDRAKKAEGDAPEIRKTYYRNYDVKYFRDPPKKIKESVRMMSSYPYSQPVCPPIKESNDNLPPRSRRFIEQFSNNSVNTEIQAAVKMVSREVATVPRPEPIRRTVAVPLSPSSSNADRTTEGDSNLLDNSKSTQKSFTLKRKAVQTVSFTDLTSSDNDFNVENSRKSKSQEELRMTDDYFRRKVLAVFKNVSCDAETKEKLKDECLRRLLNGRAVERAHASYNRCIDTMSIAFPQNCRQFDEEIIKNGRVHHMGIYDNITQVFHAEVTPFNVNEDIDCAIKNWVDGLPINTKDFSSDSDKKHILSNMAFKLKELIVIRFRNEIANLKTDILEMIEEVPIDTNISCSKNTYLNRLVDTLLERIRTTFVNQNIDCDNINKRVKTPVRQTPPAKEYLKEFIREYLWEYLRKSNINISDTQIRDIENELTDILANAIDSGNYRDMKHQMKYILTEIGNLADEQSEYFINVLLDKFKKITMTNSYTQIYTVLQNTTHSSTINNSNFTIEGINEGDLNANLDLYMNQLCIQIDDWLTNLNVNQMQDRGFRQVVVHDFAGDIIDRHKYLELNPASRGSNQEEIEQLKYQIFKWINKLVGEDNTETIQHAEDLMTRIRSIPVPMLRIPSNTTKDISSNQGQASTCPSPQCETSYSNKCKPNQTVDVSYVGRRMSSPAQLTSTANMSQGAMDPRINRSAGPAGSGPVSSLTDNVSPGVGERRTETNGFTQRVSPEVNRGPQGLKSEVKSTLERMTNPMPQSPKINRNIRDNRMSFPGATTGATMRGTNISLPALGSSPVTNVTGQKNFPNNRISELVAINSDSTKLYSSNINRHIPLGQTSHAAESQVADATMNEVSRPNSSGPQPSCCPTQDPTSLSIKRLNEEFDEYIKNWVQEVPIVVTKPEEQQVAEKARLGLYNGIWKAITKLKFEPTIFHNRFYFQDMFDNELEDLLNILPKTPELEKKKYALKAKLVEKTTDATEKMLSLGETANYKQQLVENVENSLPAVEKTVENDAKLHEDLQKLCMAETYILYIRYKDEDPVRANVYRKKLLKNIETHIDDIKKHHGKELKDIDPALYMNEVVSALNKVPIPSENTIREEADEILLGLEIEQWYSDLPLIKNDNFTVELQRRRLRDALEKKIHDLEKERNLSDCVASKELRQHIGKFLEKVGLQDGTDINFVTDELVNRLKNRPRDGVRRKSVAFQEPQDYHEFQNNMQLCSTMRPEQVDDSIRRRSVGFQEPQDYQEFSRNMPYSSSFAGQPIQDSLKNSPSFQESDGHWISLDETRIPPAMSQNGWQSSQSLHQAPPVPSASYSSPKSMPQSYTNMPQPTGQNSSKQFQESNQGFSQIGLPTQQQTMQEMTNMRPANESNRSTCCGQPTCPNSSKNFQESSQGFSQNGYKKMAACGLDALGTIQAVPNGVNSQTASTLPCNSKYMQGNASYKTDREGTQEFQSSSSQQPNNNNSRMYAIPLSGQPMGYSIPKQYYREMSPERARKHYQKQRPLDGDGRRLEMEDTESEVERETCRCMERCRRRRRRQMMVPCGEYDVKCPQLIPVRCPYAYFFQ